MMFNIGDSVIVKEWDELPEDFRFPDGRVARSRGKICGQKGTIVDILDSEALGGTVYRFRAEGESYPKQVLFTEDCFRSTQDVTYRVEVEYAEDKCYAVLYAIRGEDKKELDSAYGYIRSNTAEDITQAASYAAFVLMRRTRGEIGGKLV